MSNDNLTDVLISLEILKEIYHRLEIVIEEVDDIKSLLPDLPKKQEE